MTYNVFSVNPAKTAWLAGGKPPFMSLAPEAHHSLYLLIPLHHNNHQNLLPDINTACFSAVGWMPVQNFSHSKCYSLHFMANTSLN